MGWDSETGKAVDYHFLLTWGAGVELGLRLKGHGHAEYKTFRIPLPTNYPKQTDDTFLTGMSISALFMIPKMWTQSTVGEMVK